MWRGRRDRSYARLSPCSSSSSAFSAGTRSSSMNFRPVRWRYSDRWRRRAAWRRFISASPSGVYRTRNFQKGGEKATRPRVAEDRGAELLVDEDTGARLRHVTSDGGEEAVVDDRLGRRDPLRLLGGERARPAEQARLERPAVVERENVERPVEPEVRHDSSMRRRRWRRMSAFVELSCRSDGSVVLSSSGMMRCASCFPSS